MKRSQTLQLLARLSELYPAFEVSQARAEAWQEVLDPFPADAVRVAVSAYVQEGREFAPNPGQLIARLKELVGGPEPEIQAGEAWEKVLRFVREFPPQLEPQMDAKHPLLGTVVGMVGGWSGLRASDSGQLLNSTRPHFLRLYARAVAEEKRKSGLDRLREALPEASVLAIEEGTNAR